MESKNIRRGVENKMSDSITTHNLQDYYNHRAKFIADQIKAWNSSRDHARALYWVSRQEELKEFAFHFDLKV